MGERERGGVLGWEGMRREGEEKRGRAERWDADEEGGGKAEGSRTIG